MPETIVQLLCSACGKPAVIYYTESRMAYCDRHRPSGLCLDTSHREERERLVRQREIAEAERDKARAEADALLNLIVQPWTRDGDGGGDGNSTQLWKVNLAWWDTATSREEGVAMVRKAAGLEAQP
jgi:hypothetical protein